MPYIPHDAAETAAMLAAVGVERLDQLFDEIPPVLQAQDMALPEGLSEMALQRELEGRALANAPLRCFAGGGAYAHHIPAVVWEIAGRGEFYSAYTPYQAEASQGTLQLIYEYQSFITRLTGLEVSNASLYDGASGLAEACLMALRIQGGDKSILVPENLLPGWRRVLDSVLGLQNIRLVSVPYDRATGTLILPADAGDAAALIILQSNALGLLEPVDALTDWAHAHGLLAIAVVNPLALALLKAPGVWGTQGADMAVGEGQPLGIPLSGGGPYFGFLACRKAQVRQLPGRLVAKTVDGQGREGFCLTLQAREQHIRRGKATSNICTNQGLMVTAATIHMAALGGHGLQQTAVRCHERAVRLRELLTGVPGVSLPYGGAFFHEFVVRLPHAAVAVRDALLGYGLLAGLPLSDWGMGEAGDLLVCTTELLEEADLLAYRGALTAVLETL
ncbi:aminomethyl-transferring glycine dehydrogenase subunit GcvPA [Acidithiobacillus sp. 'AMD consortium']|jgi:glycine dehydrogenase subunit 1|uniref:Aminomethyl-transferring glycine dehydrogenase subunit GcvPA n=2 Tax=Acidithiobacillus ferridurans TaxID=1232575 RepID=A0A8X8G942_ACIFI|nr:MULTISPECIES: aminomethyl-transferring glycine dehydrogenase subunit GcvPA [Acidithiobacillus]MBU2717263.1 aminomethyl-transferring glycine dehydrogenase subunit GcvPA [Acidithiobacillus ferridurans]MBU2722194.1 aminomethyl-transferring glycine dehydrogenase subunit GcvPA [Acidithiobacillus ferridurans]MBU2725505.1 aminomethyl-transferring glycine dehydrogenase subunit GcvPA [Acidithiobacillus ferridurans]MBU2734050.1 aminomethyl-transferring glycine dehydrogenase subunit GcvPA [Acidithiobac